MISIWAEEAGPGDAPLVVLIHGSMDRSTGMLRLSRRLDDRFRVLRYDRRGYGRSVQPDRGPVEFGMDAQVADLVTLLDGRRAVLVGHSYGGNVAMAAAARQPGLVAAVAMYETPLSWEPWWPATTAGAAASSTDAEPADAAERFMRRLVSDATWDALPLRTRSTRRAEGSALVGELRDLNTTCPWMASEISCPVVVAYGADGAPHHRRGMEFVHEQFAGSARFVLDGCRHDAPMSNSQLFADTVVAAAARAAGEPWTAALSRQEAP